MLFLLDLVINYHLIIFFKKKKDKLFWNAFRVYGKLRFPLLTEGWEVIDVFGFNKKNVNDNTAEEAAILGYYQPIFILKNIIPKKNFQIQHYENNNYEDYDLIY